MTLWREVQNDMFKLWCLAEDDLLDPDNYYSLRDTGQVNINTFTVYIPRIKLAVALAEIIVFHILGT